MSQTYNEIAGLLERMGERVGKLEGSITSLKGKPDGRGSAGGGLSPEAVVAMLQGQASGAAGLIGNDQLGYARLSQPKNLLQRGVGMGPALKAIADGASRDAIEREH